jgi:polar amino acid transport system permease protein
MPIIRAMITTFVTIIRGTPMLIQILFAVLVLPQLGISIPTLWAVIMAIGLNSSAYISNIVRAGISSVGRGQLEAGKVLGLSSWQITRFIVLPQALRIALPALGNEFITLVKDSSLASVVGITELTQEGRMELSKTFDALTIYTGVALVYLVITTTLSLLISYAERRMNVHVRD